MTQIIESLNILDNSVGSVSKSLKFIQLSFHKPFWNMMGSECLLELVPGDNMIIREQGIIMIPSKASSTAKLLRSKEGLICI